MFYFYFLDGSFFTFLEFGACACVCVCVFVCVCVVFKYLCVCVRVYVSVQVNLILNFTLFKKICSIEIQVSLVIRGRYTLF